MDEPSFSEAYAQMCKTLATMQVPVDRKNENEEQPEVKNFRKLLIGRCQEHFEKNSAAELDRKVKLKEIEETADPVSCLSILNYRPRGKESTEVTPWWHLP